MKASIVLKRVDGKKEKFKNFSIGGFTAVSQDGREFHFDFDMMEGSFVDCEVICWLRDFNTEDFEDHNKENKVKSSEITGEFIANSKLTEVFYEAFNDDEDEVIPLDVIRFEIYDGEAYSFSKEALEEFNRDYAHYKS